MEEGGEVVLNLGAVLRGPELEVEREVHVEVRDGVVSHIGRGFVPQGRSVVELRTGVAIPGLVNAHVHPMDYAIPEAGLDLPLSQLVSWPNGLKHRLLRQAHDGLLSRASMDVLRKMLRQGVHYSIAFYELGLRGATVGLEARREVTVESFVLARPERVEEVEEVLSLSDGLGLDSPLRYSVEELRRMAKAAREAGGLVAVHVAEDQASRERGDLEAALYHLSPDFIVHGTHLSDEDIQELAERGVSVVVCPRSNLHFAVGVPPVAKMFEAGINVLVGTDNAGWVEPDLWRELEALYFISRLQGRGDPREVLKAACINPAKLSKLDVPKGIEEGERANLLILDGSALGIERSSNLHASIVKRGGEVAVLASIRPKPSSTGRRG